MSSISQDQVSRPAKRIRFSLLTLFWWQLLLAPLYLAWVYAYADNNRDVWIQFFAALVAPVCYSGLFVLWSIDSFDRDRLPVLSAVRRGAVFGALFGFFSRGIILLPHFVEPIGRLRNLRFAVVRANPWDFVLWILKDMGELLLFIGLFVFIFGLFGAATGGVMGLARDVLTRHRFVRTPPEP